MHSSMIVKVHILVKRYKRFFKRHKFTSTKQIAFQYTMKRFNVGVHVGSPRRNSLMGHPQVLTGISKPLAYKLRPIVRSDHG